MKLIQALPDHSYFVWQLYVQMLNFREYGIEQDAIILVAVTTEPSAKMEAFRQWTKASVIYYQDTRVNKEYASSIRPHLLAKYFRSERAPEVFFYHDQDIIFIQKPDIDKLAAGQTCYVAPEPVTPNDYLSSVYCRKFDKDGKSHFSDICTIIGIDKETVIANDANCGGAQYIIKNVDYKFWEKVEHDCEAVYQHLRADTEKNKATAPYHIQIWTSDMWAVIYNLWLLGKETRQCEEIGFNWPYEAPTKPIMHNAGITASNENNKDGKPVYFNKSRFNGGDFPFGKDFSYVSKGIAQYKYIQYFNELLMTKQVEAPRRKILGVFCTTNKISPVLLQTVLTQLKLAVESTTLADVNIVTCSWKEIPDNPFEGRITPFNDLGHLNYILQIKQALVGSTADMVCMLEHDVLYPNNYFDEVVKNWDYNKYGVCNNNYIGMNETGYLAVKERHQPYSLMSMAKFFLEQQLDYKVNKVISNIVESELPGYNPKYGWCCVEPDDKTLFAHIPFTDNYPAIHVNMNHMGGYGTGKEGKNHHFTSHCEVCYESESNGVTVRSDWGDFERFLIFKPQLEECIT